MGKMELSHAHATGRWYLWDGGFLALGRTEGMIPAHAHHAIQVVIGLDGEPAVSTSGKDWRASQGFIVRPDAVHSYDGKGATGAMLFVDPESNEGVWLQSALKQDVTVIPGARIAPCVSELRKFWEEPFDSMEVSALIRHCMQCILPGAPPARRIDPRIAAVLKSIRDADDLQIPIEAAASTAFLSPSRFAHLFKEQVGLPYRRYVLWRKVTRAVLSIAREGTIAAAAHAAGFADAAHLTRTFDQMFGIPPSVMMRGDFFEISPPFQLSGGAAADKR